MLEREVREMDFVKRWSVLRRVREQSVAAHSFHVALYAVQIADRVKWNGDRGALLRSALSHDLPECSIGDIPGPAKRLLVDEWTSDQIERRYMETRFPDDVNAWLQSKEDPMIRLLIKVGDLLDELMYLQTEGQLGNQNIGHLDLPNTPLGNSYKRLHTTWWTSQILIDSDAWGEVVDAIEAAGHAYSNTLCDHA